jgi:hypothetical protein
MSAQLTCSGCGAQYVCRCPFPVGRRVEIAPHTDLWMRGDRYGVVTRTTRTRAYVRFDRSERTSRIPTDLLSAVD